MRITEAFKLYEHYVIMSMHYSPNTARCYENTCKAVVKYFGDIRISRLTLDSIKDFYIELLTDHSTDTARQYVTKIRVIMRFCRSRGVRTVNPDLIVTPRAEKRAARFLSLEQYERLLRTASAPKRGYSKINRVRNELIVEILYHTGLRVGELCALNRDSVHDRQFVVVGKSKEPRVCFITRKIEQKISYYLSLRTDTNNALFIANETQERITPHGVQDMFRKLSKRSGIVATPHTLRHSFATRLIEDGVDIRYVAAFLGHQSLQTTQRYTHVRNAKLYEIYENVMNYS